MASALRKRPTLLDLVFTNQNTKIKPPNRFYTNLRNSLEMRNLLDNEALDTNKYKQMMDKQELAQLIVKSSQALPKEPVRRPESYDMTAGDEKLALVQAAMTETAEEREE